MHGRRREGVAKDGAPEDSTRKNYHGTMQDYWVPFLAQYPLDKITPVLMRKVVNAITWTSPIRRKGAIRLATGLLAQAVKDELILRNPANSIPPTRVVKREIDPFSREEADDLIAKLYKVTSGLQSIYACFFEFSFYTGMRPGEAMALRRSEVDMLEARQGVPYQAVRQDQGKDEDEGVAGSFIERTSATGTRKSQTSYGGAL